MTLQCVQEHQSALRGASDPRSHRGQPGGADQRQGAETAGVVAILQVPHQDPDTAAARSAERAQADSVIVHSVLYLKFY